jgi:hypothetical protein
MHDFWALLFGAFLATAGGFLRIQYERNQERKSLKAALAAEIRAILSIVERRDYIAGMETFIDSIDAQQNNLFQIRIARDYDVVFRANCNRIGLLPAHLSERVVQFYYLIYSAVEDIRLLADANVSPELRLPWRLDTPDGNRVFHQQLLEISRRAIVVGEAVATELAGPNRRGNEPVLE